MWLCSTAAASKLTATHEAQKRQTGFDVDAVVKRWHRNRETRERGTWQMSRTRCQLQLVEPHKATLGRKHRFAVEAAHRAAAADV